MALASVMSNGRGATDRLLAGVVAQLAADGVRIAGALRERRPEEASDFCNSDLLLLPEGPVVRISQDLGAGSTACRLDAGALEDAVGIVSARVAAERVDLFVLNKFGLSEAEGRGFRTLIAEMLARDVPVLVGLSAAHRVAFEHFSDGLADALSPNQDAVLAWCRAMVRGNATVTEEA